MAINAQYQNSSYTHGTASLSAQSMVEIKFSGLETGEACAVYPQISLTSCEVSSGRVNYSGRLIVTLVYAEDGKLCRVQRGAEFSHYIDDDRLAPAQTADCTLVCAKYQLKREGSSIVVAVVADARINVYDSAQRNILSALDGAICRVESGKFYSYAGFSGESEVEDDFDCVADDVLIPSAQAVVTDCNINAGSAEICGEIYLCVLAVRDNAPVNLDRVIPFKCEIPCEDALFSQRAFCRADIKSVNVNCKVLEDRAKCSVEFSAMLAFSGHYYEEEEYSYIADAFCKEREIALKPCGEQTFIDNDIKVYSERVSGACASKAKLDYTCAFLAVTLPFAEFARTQDGIEGAISATLLYEQGGEVHSTEINLPFAVKLSGLSCDCANVSVAVCGVSVRQRAEGECEGEATLKISCADGEVRQVKYVTEVEEGEEKPATDCAISVYIPTAGDGLWETAKRLGEAPESISASNPELVFPLTGKERILIYRPKVQ